MCCNKRTIVVSNIRQHHEQGRVAASPPVRPAPTDAPARMLGLARDAAEQRRHGDGGKNKHNTNLADGPPDGGIGSAPARYETKSNPHADAAVASAAGRFMRKTEARAPAMWPSCSSARRYCCVTPVNRMTLDEWRNPMQKAR